MCIRDRITGVEGRVFQRDQYGNLFYSVNGGFAFSIDDGANFTTVNTCLLYTSDAADERSSVDLGGRRFIKKKQKKQTKTQ